MLIQAGLKGYDPMRIGDLVTEYRARRRRQKVHTKHARRFVKAILEKENENESESIRFLELTARTKRVHSLQAKLRRVGGHGEPSRPSSDILTLDDIKDLTGVRVVLFDSRDLKKARERICDGLLDSSFEEKSDMLEPDQFGYRSLHIFGRLPRTGKKASPSWPIEVQIRSALQHAWALLSHKMLYKSDDAAPVSLKRQLSLLSGLLEIGDTLWRNVIQSQENYRKETKERVAKGDLTVNVSKISMDLFGESNELQQAISNIDLSVDLDLPHESCGRRLLAACQIMKITTLDGLLEQLTSYNPDRDDMLRRLSARQTKRLPEDHAFCLYHTLELVLWRWYSRATSASDGDLSKMLKDAGWEDEDVSLIMDVRRF
ncbi:MAG: hypothetical protein OXG44_12190 [Gammaproteobacteria bacterium]|nr:hypothetical protein [Gammaproteobacteria bacterium]